MRHFLRWEDLVGWFEQHPYLQTDKPQQVTVGGIKGEQFDVVVGELPEDYPEGLCGFDCVQLSAKFASSIAPVQHLQPSQPSTTVVSISLATARLEAIPRPARPGGTQWHRSLPESPKISPSTGIKRHS
jgi:hypothetical protein